MTGDYALEPPDSLLFADDEDLFEDDIFDFFSDDDFLPDDVKKDREPSTEGDSDFFFNQPAFAPSSSSSGVAPSSSSSGVALSSSSSGVAPSSSSSGVAPSSSSSGVAICPDIYLSPYERNLIIALLSKDRPVREPDPDFSDDGSAITRQPTFPNQNRQRSIDRPRRKASQTVVYSLDTCEFSDSDDPPYVQSQDDCDSDESDRDSCKKKRVKKTGLNSTPMNKKPKIHTGENKYEKVTQKVRHPRRTCKKQVTKFIPPPFSRDGAVSVPPRFNQVGTKFEATKLYVWKDGSSKGLTLTPLPAIAAGSEKPIMLQWESIRKCKTHTTDRRPVEPCLVCADDKYPGGLRQQHAFRGCSLTPCTDLDETGKKNEIPANISFPIYGHCCGACYNNYKRYNGIFSIRDRVVVMNCISGEIKQELIQTAHDLQVLPEHLPNKMFMNKHHKPYFFKLTENHEVVYTGDVPLKISAPILSWGGKGAFNVTPSYLAVYPNAQAHIGPCNIVVYPTGTELDISVNIKFCSAEKANCRRRPCGIVYVSKRIRKGDVLWLAHDVVRLWDRFFPDVPFINDKTSPLYLSIMEKLRVIVPDDPSTLSPTDFQTFLEYNLEPQMWNAIQPLLPNPMSYATLRDFVMSALVLCDDAHQAAVLKFLPVGLAQ